MKKAYTLFMLAFLGSVFFGLFSDFHPNQNFVWSTPAWAAILVLSLLFFPWLLDKNPGNKALSFGPFKKALWYFGIYCFYVLFSMGFACYTLPSFYTNLYGKPFAKHTEVTRKSDGYHRRGCDVRMHVELFQGKICISNHFYSSIQAGDLIRLEGLESNFGYKLFSFRKSEHLTSKASG